MALDVDVLQQELQEIQQQREVVSTKAARHHQITGIAAGYSS